MTHDISTIDVEIPDDQRFQLQSDIAERLAVLSDVADTPTDFDRSGGSFSASEVDFGDGSWMSRLADVQGWLRLQKELPADADDFVEELAKALKLSDSSTALDTSGQSPQLSVAGLGRLYEWADQAVRLQQTFVEKIDDSGSRTAATKAWSEGWDEEPEPSEAGPLEPVSAVADTFRISDFTGMDLNLMPSYQRGDVWGASARQKLIESILRGIPLPSVILLQPQSSRLPYEVVDGKQRLTAILRFVGRHPLAIRRVEEADKLHEQDGVLLKTFWEDYPKFKQMWKGLEHEPITSKVEDENFFPFKLRTGAQELSGNLEPLQGKYFTQIREHEIRAADQLVTVGKLFESTPKYRIPVILYERASQSQIREVFNLYNKQGVHLNAEEIRNALFHELELTRAVLVAAGDSDPRANPRDISPALDGVWPDVEHLASTLKHYGFGDSRYRRTKVLSWVIATLLGDTGGKDLPSTARHIDDILAKARISNTLNKPGTVAALLLWIAASAKVHASYDEELWAPFFKDGGTGQRWQELQLIGSLVGVAIAYIADPDGIDNALENAADDIFSASGTAERGEEHSLWARPRKTQTRTQWAYIARVAKAVTESLGVDSTAASFEIRKRFGSSGVESLLAVLNDDSE